MLCPHYTLGRLVNEMSPTARRKANAGDEQMPQQMRREGADGIFRIGMLTFDRGAIGEGEVKVVKAVEDHVAGGFGGLGDLGEASFLQIVNDGQFAEGFGFDGFDFVGPVEDGFEGFLFVTQDFGHLGQVEALANPGHVLAEVRMRAREGIDSFGKVVGIKGLAGIGEKERDVEQGLILGEDGALPGERQFPETVVVPQRVREWVTKRVSG